MAATGSAITLETLRVEIRAEIQKYKTDLKKAETATTTSSTRMRTALEAVRTALGAIGIVTGLMAAITKIVQLGKESIELASDLEEVQNVVDVTFGNMSDQIDEFATNAITQFGLSQTAAKQYASTVGAMLKSMGFDGQELVDMSTNLAGLAADMASFYNLDTDEAFAKIRAGLAGQTEPLAAIGIDLSVANLQEYALSQGITTAYNALTRQEQALLRYNLLLQQTTDSQGDFARTSDGWANQVRVMREQINALKAEIGSGLIEILLPIVRGINWLLSQVIKGIQALRRFFSRGGGIANVQHNGLDVAVDTTNNLTAAANTASTAVGGIGKAAKAAGKAFTNSSFDELHQLSSPSSGSGGSGGGGGAGVFSDLLGDEDLFDDGARAAGGFSGAVDEATESVGGFWKWVEKVNRNWEAGQVGLAKYNEAYLELGTRVGERVANFVQTKWLPAQEAAQVGMNAYDEAVRNTWSTVKNKFGGALSTVRNKLRGFVNGSDEARYGIQKFNEATVNGWHDVAVALGLVSDDANEKLPGVTEKMSGVAATSKQLADKLTGLSGNTGLKDFGSKINDLGTKSLEAADNVGSGMSLIEEHISQMHMNAQKPISDFNTEVGKTGTAAKGAASVVKQATIGGTGSIVAHLKSMNTNAAKPVSDFGTTVGKAGTSAKGVAGTVRDYTIGKTGSVIAHLTAMKTNASKPVSDFGTAVGKVGTAAKNAAGSVRDYAIGKTGSVIAHLTAMKTNASKPVSDFGTTVGKVGTAAKNAASEVQKQTVGKNGSVVAFLSRMNTDGSSYTDKLKLAISGKLTEAANSATGSASSIKTSVVNAVSGAKTELSANKFTDLGTNIKNGIIGGMGDFKWDLQNYCNQFKAEIKRQFGIKSPSKWMRDEVGIYLGEGMAEGMDDSQRRILATCDSIAAAMAGSFTQMAPTFSPTVSGPASGSGWVESLAANIAQSVDSSRDGQEQRPIVCEVYLDRDRIASAVSKGQRAQSRRYSSVAMA